jgi:vacuolar-type H+-ATPase subunit E/Vma4
VAISDILLRIESDAAAEVAEILGSAEADERRIGAQAAERRESVRAAALVQAGREAAEDAATILANERLAARDALLAARGRHVEALLTRAVTALEDLQDPAYFELIVRAARALARGGEVVAVAASDTERLAALPAALHEAGIDVTLAHEPASVERGVVLTGDRVRVEISPASIVAERRDELTALVASALFGVEG